MCCADVRTVGYKLVPEVLNGKIQQKLDAVVPTSRYVMQSPAVRSAARGISSSF
jgi:hypothetical protein